MALVKWLNVPVHGDDRGELAAIESEKIIPFPIRRVYYLFGTKDGVSRGHHAHRALEQVAICVSGKCRIVLDDGKTKEAVWLDKPEKGLYIEKMIWREMYDFSSDCVLLVLANAHYDESDYIRGYDEFLKAVAK